MKKFLAHASDASGFETNDRFYTVEAEDDKAAAILVVKEEIGADAQLLADATIDDDVNGFSLERIDGVWFVNGDHLAIQFIDVTKIKQLA